VNTREASLVSVNDFIEHSPLFAKRLIDSADVIREGALRDEVARCMAEVWPRTRAWLSTKWVAGFGWPGKMGWGVFFVCVCEGGGGGRLCSCWMSQGVVGAVQLWSHLLRGVWLCTDEAWHMPHALRPYAGCAGAASRRACPQ
jgi:hypothetical protein